MLARAIQPLRSRPGRTAALALVLLLALGAAVAAFSDGTGSVGGDEATSGRHLSAGDSAVDAQAPLAAASGEAKSRAGGGSATGLNEASANYDLAAPVASAVAGSPVPGGAGVSPDVVGPGGLGGAPVPEAVASGSSRIVKTAVLSVGVDKGKLSEAYQAAQDAAARAGGWVQSSERSTDQATLVVKVPSDRFDSVLGELRKLGEVRTDSVAGEDVSAEYVDLEARLKHWRAQEAVFLELMAKAKSIPETISIQQQLSVIQEQIEQHEGRRRYLDGQTAFSTVRLSVLESGAVAQEPDGAGRTTLARAWERAVGATLAVVGGSLVVLGVVVPLALILGLPALVFALARRRNGRVPVPAPAPQG